MGPAWEGPAALGINPEVRGSSIWNHGEGLSWGSDLDVDEVLGVHVVLDSDVLSTEELALDVLGLVLVHVHGHFSLVDWDLSSGGGSEEGGDGE